MTTSTSRSIAKEAVRARLAERAFAEVLRRGYSGVTLSELAEACGVSRSTFLRYLGSKEEAALGGLAVYGERLAARVLARPDAESPWLALRTAMADLAQLQGSEPSSALALTALIHSDSALYKARWQPHLIWRRALVEALLSRTPALSPLAAESLAAAALGCLDAASDAWMATGGTADFEPMLAEAFDAVGAAL